MQTVNEVVLGVIRQFNADYEGDDRDLSPWLADRICLALRTRYWPGPGGLDR